MALYMQSNDFSAKRTGVTANVPNNDVARLMYYLNCVCDAIDCNHDTDIQRFTNYHNWARLSIDEQKALIVVCYTCSPDVLNNRVFFNNDVLCGNSSNEFYTINQVRNQILAAQSIIIAGQQRVVNKIMTYKMQWMKTYYFDPMSRLVARFSAPTPPPSRSITYTSPTHSHPYRPPTVVQPNRIRRRRGCCCICCIIFIVILILIGIGIGVFYILKQRRII